jgi:ribonucleotide reductase, class II
MTKTLDASQKILSDITIFMKYAKYLPHLNRRENWEELIDRNKGMHLKKFPEHQKEIEDAYKFVYDKKILPSMRMLQFSGKPIEINNTRGYNCCFLPVDDWRAFSEIMFLLLGGTGVGFSVQSHDIEKLPEITKPNPKQKRRYLIGDSIEGWADAVKVLMKSYFFGGSTINFDFNDIRQKGARLLTSGGKAPGPDPLKMCLLRITSILDAKQNGEKLSSLEVHDIVCFIADAVLAGGIRRAALISLFSADDEKMLSAKTGNWWELNPQRGRANNSAVLLRHKITKDFFMDLWKTIEFSNAGEPGFIFMNERDTGFNPCCVSGDSWILTSEGPRQVKELIGKKFNVISEGQKFETESEGFWETGEKDVYEIETTRGFKIKMTPDHRVLTQNGDWVAVGELKKGQKIKLSNQDASLSWEGKGNFEEGWLLGSLIGDGTFGENAQLCFWGNSSEFMKNLASGYVKNNLDYRNVKRVGFGEGSVNYKFHHEGKAIITSKGLSGLADQFNIYRGHKVITDKIEQASSDFYCGFLRGLFDADGTVANNHQKGCSIRLTQVNLENLERVQRMLSRLGIVSSIYKNRNRSSEGLTMMPDGKGGKKLYPQQPTHELCISRSNLEIFQKTNWI